MTKSHKEIEMPRKILKILGQPLLATAIGLLVGMVVIVIAGENPIFVYTQMFEKSFFNSYYLMQTLTRAVPITVCSIAIIIAWRAGYINLGVEGQMIVGALVGTAVAIYVPGPVPLVMALAVFCGMAAGALYSLFAAYIYMKFEVSIVISTLMMNYIASYVSSYFVTFPLKDPKSGLSIQTLEIPAGMKLMRVFENNTFNIGFFITIGIVLLFMFVTKKTSFGYESKMTGLNPVFAQYGGVKKNNIMLKTMALSGAVAALAGMLEIFGVKYRFVDNMFGSTSYAWTGLMSALISNLHPVGAFITSIFLSGLQVGGQAIQRTTNIPLQVATLIQTTITLFVSLQLFSKYKKTKAHDKTAVQPTATQEEPHTGKGQAEQPTAQEEPITGKEQAEQPTAQEEPITSKGRAEQPAAQEEPHTGKKQAEQPTAQEEPTTGKGQAEQPTTKEEPITGKKQAEQSIAREEPITSKGQAEQPKENGDEKSKAGDE